jgi:hypothetical protein
LERVAENSAEEGDLYTPDFIAEVRNLLSQLYPPLIAITVGRPINNCILRFIESEFSRAKPEVKAKLRSRLTSRQDQTFASAWAELITFHILRQVGWHTEFEVPVHAVTPNTEFEVPVHAVTPDIVATRNGLTLLGDVHSTLSDVDQRESKAVERFVSSLKGVSRCHDIFLSLHREEDFHPLVHGLIEWPLEPDCARDPASTRKSISSWVESLGREEEATQWFSLGELILEACAVPARGRRPVRVRVPTHEVRLVVVDQMRKALGDKVERYGALGKPLVLFQVGFPGEANMPDTLMEVLFGDANPEKTPSGARDRYLQNGLLGAKKATALSAVLAIAWAVKGESFVTRSATIHNPWAKSPLPAECLGPVEWVSPEGRVLIPECDDQDD